MTFPLVGGRLFKSFVVELLALHIHKAVVHMSSVRMFPPANFFIA
jgi:hypothetical protein